MAIQRFSFKEGAPIDPLGDPNEQFLNLLPKEELYSAMTLLPGEHDITPQNPLKRGQLLYRYNLIVESDGTAMCRFLPIDSNAQLNDVDFSGPLATVKIKEGGKIYYLPDPRQNRIMIASRGVDGTPSLYEAIIHTPGPSPRLARVS